jgi:Flp pilus assembly protein TadB
MQVHNTIQSDEGMIKRLSGTLHQWTGWCPNAGTLLELHDARKGFPDPADDEEKQPGTASYMAGIPAWFTTVSVIVLFATVFLGGNLWWPALVLVIAGAGLAVMCLSNHNPRRN